MEHSSESKCSVSGNESKKIFLLEDRDLFLTFMRHILQKLTAHEVVTFSENEHLLVNQEPRLLEVIASHKLPGRAFFKRQNHPSTYVVYGENIDSPTIHWCRKNGVKGILDLNDGTSDWVYCLKKLENGEPAETPTILKQQNSGNGKGIARLSRRETEVARLLVRGFSAKQVSSSLGTSEGTVKNQRKAVYRKLGIVRATQLAGAMGLTKSRP